MKLRFRLLAGLSVGILASLYFASRNPKTESAAPGQ
jgi:hypothetical protein